MSPRAALEGLLLACVREPDRAASLAEAVSVARRSGALDELPPLAAYHGVTGCVRDGLRGADVGREIVEALEQTTTAALARHLAALGDLAEIGRVLDAAAVPWLVFKGPVLAETIYARPDLRAYQDLDLLVPPERFGDAIAALEHDGAEVRDRNWRLLRGEMRGQVHLWLRYGSAADLHWHVVNRGRRASDIPTRDLFSRARTLTLNGVTVRTLDPADTLIHLAVHAGLEGAHRLAWLKDVERAVAAGGFDWHDVVMRARAWNSAPLVALVLRRAHRVLGAAVPRDVLHELAGPVRRATFAAADRLFRVSAGRRQRAPYVIGSLAARGFGWTAGALGHRALRSIKGLPGDTPATVLKDEGGESDRAGYLAAVASMGGRSEGHGS